MNITNDRETNTFYMNCTRSNRLLFRHTLSITSLKVCPNGDFFLALADLIIVVNVLSNFANITLSSLYLDIVKDTLYADANHSIQRRSVVTALERVKDLSVLKIITLLTVLARS
jgi:hypothetical protein